MLTRWKRNWVSSGSPEPWEMLLLLLLVVVVVVVVACYIIIIIITVVTCGVDSITSCTLFAESAELTGQPILSSNIQHVQRSNFTENIQSR